MPNFSYAVHDGLAGWLAGLPFPAPPVGVYAGLLTAAPSPDGTGVSEPNDAGYARQPITFVTSRADGVTTLINAVPLVFGDAITEWTPVNYFGLFDPAGGLILYGRLRTQRTCTPGKSLTFASGAITVGLR